MNFDEAFEHVKAGTASDEESSFVERELDNLRKIREILDNPASENIFHGADEETVLKARKAFNKKTTIKIIVIVLISLLVIAATVCGIIFIPSCTSASRNQVIYETEAVELAKNHLIDMGVDVDSLYIRKVDRELRIPSSLKNAIYIYEIEFRSVEIEYELEVSTKSGYVIVTDIDYD